MLVRPVKSLDDSNFDESYFNDRIQMKSNIKSTKNIPLHDVNRIATHNSVVRDVQSPAYSVQTDHRRCVYTVFDPDDVCDHRFHYQQWPLSEISAVND